MVRLYRASILHPRTLVSPPCSSLSQITDLAISGKCSGPEMFEIREPYNTEAVGVEAKKPKARTFNSSTAMKDHPVCCILAAPHSAPPEAVANEGWLLLECRSSPIIPCVPSGNPASRLFEISQLRARPTQPAQHTTTLHGACYIRMAQTLPPGVQQAFPPPTMSLR